MDKTSIEVRSEACQRRVRRFRFILLCGMLSSNFACATSPPVARPGYPLRVTTAEQDTLFGTLSVVRTDTLVLTEADGDSLLVARRTIERVDFDRTRRHWWSGTVAMCVLAASYVGLTAVEASQEGWSWRMAYGSLMLALWGQECIDTRPKWTLARIEDSEK